MHVSVVNDSLDAELQVIKDALIHYSSAATSSTPWVFATNTLPRNTFCLTMRFCNSVEWVCWCTNRQISWWYPPTSYTVAALQSYTSKTLLAGDRSRLKYYRHHHDPVVLRLTIMHFMYTARWRLPWVFSFVKVHRHLQPSWVFSLYEPSPRSERTSDG